MHSFTVYMYHYKTEKKKRGIMKTWKITYLVLILFFCSSISYSQSSPKLNKYPRTIQASDYEAIKFIENLYTSLSKLDKDKVNCKIKKDLISFHSPIKPTKVINLQINKENSVFLNRTRYSDISIAVLYRTLYRALSEFSKKTPIESVKYTQFSTLSYKKRTVIEFKIGNQIVVLDSDSNGSGNKERLYIVDIIKPKNSFFWGQ
jgi:hypothetical protein